MALKAIKQPKCRALDAAPIDEMRLGVDSLKKKEGMKKETSR